MENQELAKKLASHQRIQGLKPLAAPLRFCVWL